MSASETAPVFAESPAFQFCARAWHKVPAKCAPEAANDEARRRVEALAAECLKKLYETPGHLGHTAWAKDELALRDMLFFTSDVATMQAYFKLPTLEKRLRAARHVRKNGAA